HSPEEPLPAIAVPALRGAGPTVGRTQRRRSSPVSLPALPPVVRTVGRPCAGAARVPHRQLRPRPAQAVRRPSLRRTAPTGTAQPTRSRTRVAPRLAPGLRPSLRAHATPCP